MKILVTDGHVLAALATVRSLGRAGYEVWVSSHQGQASCAAALSRYAAGFLRAPSAWQQHDQFCEWLLGQCKSGYFDVVFPITEASVAATARLRRSIGDRPILALPGEDALAYTLSKYNATKLARSVGVPVPDTSFVNELTSEAEIRDRLGSLGSPFVLKIDNFYENGVYYRGSTLVLTTVDQALYLLWDLLPKGRKVIGQRLIPGFGVGASLLQIGGRTVLKFSHWRLHEVPYTGGYSSLRVSSYDEQTLEYAEKLLSSLSYTGLAMVEFRKTAGGNAYFLEINGRPWGSLALALHSGVDFPRVYVDLLTGTNADFDDSKEYRVGVKCRHLSGELKYLSSVLRAPCNSRACLKWKAKETLVFVALLLDPRVRHDYLWLGDPLPAMAELASIGHLVWSGAAKVTCRLGKALRRHLLQMENVHRQRVAFEKCMRARIRKVGFVCYGNIFRSAFAEHYWNEVLRAEDPSLPVAESAGCRAIAGTPVPRRFQELVRRSFGIDLSTHRSRLCTKEWLRSVDLVVAMDYDNYVDALKTWSGVSERCFLLGYLLNPEHPEINDPVNSTEPQQVLAICELIAQACRMLAERLESSKNLWLGEQSKGQVGDRLRAV